MTPAATHIVLLGLRCSGKTTVGRRLAECCRLAFTDLDDITAELLGEQRAGEALAKFGEQRFREAEADALGRVLHEPPQVIALGGGTPTAPRAYQLLVDAREAELVRTVYLHADPSTLQARLALDSTPRPSLTGAGAIAEVEQLYKRRDPLYRELSDRVIDATQSTSAILSELIA